MPLTRDKRPTLRSLAFAVHPKHSLHLTVAVAPDPPTLLLPMDVGPLKSTPAVIFHPKAMSLVVNVRALKDHQACPLVPPVPVPLALHVWAFVQVHLHSIG